MGLCPLPHISIPKMIWFYKSFIDRDGITYILYKIWKSFALQELSGQNCFLSDGANNFNITLQFNEKYVIFFHMPKISKSISLTRKIAPKCMQY